MLFAESISQPEDRATEMNRFEPLKQLINRDASDALLIKFNVSSSARSVKRLTVLRAVSTSI